MELLRQGDSEGLERMVGDSPVAVRFLQGRLWDADPEIRSEAATALGAAAAAHPDLGRELLRQALWALNDESATNGAPMLPAIGEIGRRAPDLAALCGRVDDLGHGFPRAPFSTLLSKKSGRSRGREVGGCGQAWISHWVAVARAPSVR